MMELDTLRQSFIAFLDGLWWGLRDNVGALSMYEGYSNGFRQMGREAAERVKEKGPRAAAHVAVDVMRAIGLEVMQEDNRVVIHSCPLWERVLKRGLEYAFHIEEICWMPLLRGIGEILGATPACESDLRTSYLERAKSEYKIKRLEQDVARGKIRQEEFQRQRAAMVADMEHVPKTGVYRFD